MEDEITEFLKKMGMKGDQPQENQWDKIIVPASSYLIVGDVGTGKTALAFWLLETFSRRYSLTPCVVGLPGDKRALLPESFLVLDTPGELTRTERVIALIDEADIQLPIEDTRARKYVINFLSLPRHRDQIFLLSFHFPRLVLGRYLPFFSAFLLKRPPYLIEFASKRQNDALSEMMKRAEERFAELPGQEDIVKNTYVVAPRLRWQGLLQNPLPKCWSVDLSKGWAGTEIGDNRVAKQIGFFPEHRLVAIDGKTIITGEMRARRVKLEDIHTPNQNYSVWLDPFTNVQWLE